MAEFEKNPANKILIYVLGRHWVIDILLCLKLYIKSSSQQYLTARKSLWSCRHLFQRFRGWVTIVLFCSINQLVTVKLTCFPNLVPLISTNDFVFYTICLLACFARFNKWLYESMKNNFIHDIHAGIRFLAKVFND